MGRTPGELLLLCAALALMLASAENNLTSGSLVWSSAKEEGGLLHSAEAHDGVVSDDSDGGFSSLDGMLQWAIGHSDPAKLKEKADDVRRLSPSDLKQRQADIKELMDNLKMPSDADLMKIAIDDLKNSSLSLEDRYRALEELLVLVEPIDNANDLDKLGGLIVIVRELNHSNPDIRTIAAWILGKASQNNPLAQEQILKFGVLAKLMKMVKSSFIEEATKALYAVSTLIRNNLAGQEVFYAEAGDLMLQGILSDANADIRLRKKAVFLVGDLAAWQLENMDIVEPPFLSDRFLLKSVVDLTVSPEIDLQEKALVTIKNLLLLRTTEALVFKEFCALDSALGRMSQSLHDLMADGDRRDYALDLEILRGEIELIFHKKLGKMNGMGEMMSLA